MHRNARPPVTTGFTGFFGKPWNLYPHELTVVASEPHCGATALSVCIALNSAKSGSRVYYASGCESIRDLTMRAIAIEAELAVDRIYAKDSHLHHDAILQASTTVTGLPIWFYRDENSLSTIRDVVISAGSVNNVDLLVIDNPASLSESTFDWCEELRVFSYKTGIPALCFCRIPKSGDAENCVYERANNVILMKSCESDSEVKMESTKGNWGETAHAFSLTLNRQTFAFTDVSSKTN